MAAWLTRGDMPYETTSQKVAVLDAGGQYCHLIARKLREIGVLAEVKPCSTPSAQLRDYEGIVISGGPASVYADNAPRIDSSIFDLHKPVLGICYGHQYMAHVLGGEVRRGKVAEYGVAHLSVLTRDSLLKNLNAHESVWMSHRDRVLRAPEGFQVLASTEACPIAAMGDDTRKLYGVQFHPEVAHTQHGKEILQNFANICGCKLKRWNPEKQIDKILEEIREKAADKKVFFLVSGGVDSSVAFMLCVKALGPDRVEGLYIDTGLMRENDRRDIEYLVREERAKIRIVDAQDEFFPLVETTYNPEVKRKRIGKKFVQVFERYLSKHFKGSEDNWILGQGTIYPDTIESGGTQYASRIKTHHNRVSVIQELLKKGKIVEPLAQFYKDEVRQIGSRIGLAPRLVSKQPFPGPGLAVRCIGCSESSELQPHPVVSACAKKYGLSGVKMNLRSVGVKGDERTYQSIAILAGDIPSVIQLEKISTEITNGAIDINRVVYLLTGKRLEIGEWRVEKSNVSRARIALLRTADDLVQTFMAESYPNQLKKIWQFPVIHIPLTQYPHKPGSIVLRPVDSADGMTASFSKLPKKLLARLSLLLQEKLGVEVLFDVTNKPPATIEWE
jgi:GMP synthase (glutamine-hydrolysing)